jgi:hypothetical protein
MPVDRETLIFFDASCIIVAAHRPTGGSGFLLRLCQRDFLRAAVSWPVLWEAEANLLAKFPKSSVDAFHRQLADTAFVIAPTPSAQQLERYPRPSM